MHPSRIDKKGCDIWSCTPFSILLLSVVLPRHTSAMYQGDGKRDSIHRVYKVKVTEDVRVWSDNAQLKGRRDGDSCPASFSLCAASLGGDCCPENYACAQSSCYATTAALSVCAGTTGMFACPLSLNGGCCPQGLACATDGCSSPAGATYTLTCPAGYLSCPASLNGGCCADGMGCAVNSCYPLSPATTTLSYTTTKDGVTLIITSTSVTTSTPTTISTVSAGDSAVPKFFPSAISKTEATATAGSSSGGSTGGGGLAKGAIGGIIAAVAAILIAVLVAAFFIIKRLRHTEKVVQTHGDATSGTRTRQTTEKKSEVNVRVVPTPSEVDAMDYDPLMMNSSVASPQRPGHQQRMAHNRARGGSDTASQPSLWSGQSATRWNNPSVNSDADDTGARMYCEQTPRVHQHPNGRPPMRQSVNSNDSAYSYHNFAHAHGRNASNASELSTGSDDNGSQHGVGSPLVPIELAVDGEFRPELPGTDADTESTGVHRQRGPKWKGAASSIINDIVSPMSMRPGAMQASRQRRRGDSQTVSPMEGRIVQDRSSRSGLGSIDESASMSATQSLHGHYGPAISGQEIDVENSPTVSGLVPLEKAEPGQARETVTRN